MKQNRNEEGFSKRLRFESDVKEDMTSGQVGPKSTDTDKGDDKE